ncbi:nucleoside triphosphate pyrophosphohydrolase [Eubacterium coprostanoligenes]|uniref:Tetrapyrrole methylase family protein / MazG family protein n=1 Tax=Eubacterium coprostanoligenes TaxID=290054 RepID=A0A1T4KKY5_9FIRM|nr:nucleoside triphosphate pyrophosphohydrolase [Eubacterium coprostanoligenes]MCI6254869.1 nucleoside triphosphate pyrophosphohydrolase [Eubacterium coprostanoligenes]MDD6665584.1 nucleoside triphosphate pyrophosphohydrolase [Eubacterium coprostanoligenes]MDD7358102.1 nucleoside triphosphate pyrophosphohydrolase [Eubacterium coprostanoligenes]MDY4698325.1 nucleoside triphosphate pyrophosphohydrolase [Eubacterium coprostanoligenes]MDY5376893.1 nucleoside triphosphate pyrophosphohydrolase [Euba
MAKEFVLKDKYNIDDLVAIIKVLRAPGGCPWDREQTHESIKKNFIEETYEVVEAINKQSTDMLREELGDVLLQIVLHSEMESENGNFSFDDVVNDIVQKLVVRHPHVFGEVVANNTAEALNSWDAVKLKTKGQKNQTESMLSVPRELPALMRAQKIQHKAAKIGFDWDNVGGAVDKLYEEIDELKTAMEQGKRFDIEDEFGDVLFSCVNIARFIDVDSEEALTASTDKFMSRFSLVEQMASEQGIDMKSSSIEELDRLWDKAKKIKNSEKSVMED